MESKRNEFLVVEDNRDDAQLLQMALTQYVHFASVTWLRNGAAALEYFFSQDTAHEETLLPRLIFLDLKLPKVDGFTVLERLKSEARTRSIPVIVLSSSHQDSDIARCYDLGANSYVVKPVDIKQFNETIRVAADYWTNISQ